VSAGTIALIVVGVSIVAWAAVIVNVAIRRQRRAALATASPAGAAEPTPEHAGGATSRGSGGGDAAVRQAPQRQRKPLTPDQMAVSRRQFLNRAWTASFTAFLGFFGMASLSFLWPKLTGGFGTEITAGNYDDLLSQIGPEAGYKPLFVPEGRFWLVYYDGTGESPVYEAIGAREAKMQAHYRKCVHLGCSVPHCETSMLFECPCHGSKYRLTGEYFGGPAPRGLDRFPVTVSGGRVVVDTGSVQTGPPRGIDTWSKFSQPQGPFCVPV
jgi:cytochrome b6-f complex iron-sulfur subunit